MTTLPLTHRQLQRQLRRRVRDLLPRRGSDGLTDRQRQHLAEKFERGLGATPSAEFYARARQAARTTHKRRFETTAG